MIDDFLEVRECFSAFTGSFNREMGALIEIMLFFDSYVATLMRLFCNPVPRKADPLLPGVPKTCSGQPLIDGNCPIIGYFRSLIEKIIFLIEGFPSLAKSLPAQFCLFSCEELRRSEIHEIQILSQNRPDPGVFCATLYCKSNLRPGLQRINCNLYLH
jgi:hypothetical protein